MLPAVWLEAAIDARTTLMIDALLATWPVPPDHVDAVEQAPVQSTYISLKMLVASDALPVALNSCREMGTRRPW